MMPETRTGLDQAREILQLKSELSALGFDWLSDLADCSHQAFIGSRQELLSVLRACVIGDGAGPRECTILNERFCAPADMLVRSHFERVPVDEIARHIRDRARPLLESLPDGYARRFDQI